LTIAMHGTRGLGSLSISLFVLIVGCSSSSGSGDNRQTTDAGATDASDGGPTTPPDPNDGRDDKPASCYATCQNTSFACKTKGSATVTTLDLAPDQTGCAGTQTKDGNATPIKLDCNVAKVCTADAEGKDPTDCVGGLFSAFSFAFTPAGGAQLVCTRN
jgi:hypothetical protein